MATFPTLAASILIVALCFVASSHSQGAGMPPPFTRVLTLQNPPMHGNDVIILQNLIVRSPFVSSLPATGNYDSATSNAVALFQKGNGLTGSMPGVFDSPTANLLLSLHSCDGTIDPGVPVGPQGYLYKLYIPLFNNRSVEVKAFLFDGNNTLLHQFRVRAHGHDTTNDTSPWPSYSNTVGLNQFTSNGNTPTGVAVRAVPRRAHEHSHTNTHAHTHTGVRSQQPRRRRTCVRPVPREPHHERHLGQRQVPARHHQRHPHRNPLAHRHLARLEQHHGHAQQRWCVASVVRACDNRRLLADDDRSLPHWLAGCVHAHPEDIAIVWRKLVSIGVQVRENPFGQQPYPFKPQGIAVIEQVGCQ